MGSPIEHQGPNSERIIRKALTKAEIQSKLAREAMHSSPTSLAALANYAAAANLESTLQELYAEVMQDEFRTSSPLSAPERD